ncbi:DUF2612 domain-containing protein [Yersinia enterocolitica]|uniref:DUF2612 domain-containing protein n=1 Tax=Yersinia enterocolitica TaxID=630 RepID=UPI001C60AF28|nr:DUF2612 domain-containing protein [Yersinia enterocolitica]MBW5868571.1 DUF2612 domain-containing protein [Yersinia enterocolitica]MBW5877521.1 DUF2612 domain-containing protein [Yersinia enterocolitica]
MSQEDTILTQYSASNRILSIIDTFNQAVSLSDFTDEFIEKVWDITTCETFGLDMWGKVVGVSRYIRAEIDNDCFGFSEADDGGGYPSPFGDSPFYAGTQETETVRLSNEAYRTLVLCKAFSNISIATIKDINRFLTMLFLDRGRAYCADYGDMRMGIICEFKLEPFEISILENYEVLPIPSGVLVSLRQIVSPYFGFAPDAYPFNDGTFFRDI